ncbi:MAG: hypothetical protein IPN76_05410 [Saprospiraceae bacterium]|jgi:hypothetical protein|nr:hypothetical protein [Saprospiraceae bacterium]
MVNAVGHINGIMEPEFGMNLSEDIQGNKVKDLITKFFYRNSHLCFHILLMLNGGDTVFFQEFTEYAEYKKAFSELQQARLNNKIISVPKKKLNKVALAENLA